MGCFASNYDKSILFKAGVAFSREDVTFSVFIGRLGGLAGAVWSSKVNKCRST